MNNEKQPHMATIWKYEVLPQDATIHEMPKGAKALHLGVDPRGRLCVWFIVDPEQPMEQRAILLVGTGHSLPMTAHKDYVGTFVAGDYVNHVFVPSMPPEIMN